MHAATKPRTHFIPFVYGKVFYELKHVIRSQNCGRRKGKVLFLKFVGSLACAQMLNKTHFPFPVWVAYHYYLPSLRNLKAQLSDLIIHVYPADVAKTWKVQSFLKWSCVSVNIFLKMQMNFNSIKWHCRFIFISFYHRHNLQQLQMFFTSCHHNL